MTINWNGTQSWGLQHSFGCNVAFAEVLTRVVDGKWIKAKIDCGDKS
jgi:hypothetical protein